ncbi:MAG TPA: cytochrome c, partial [Phenylobacterium sp.]|nr:cytochrome c [Phenylobacterium sp.]
INGPVNGTTWVQAKNLVHDETVVTQPIGQIYNTITHGIRNMAGYESQISVQDRWAIALYVKALQRSQNARESDVPADLRSRLD